MAKVERGMLAAVGGWEVQRALVVELPWPDELEAERWRERFPKRCPLV